MRGSVRLSPEMRGKLSRGADIDLGLAVSALSLRPGQCRSYGELAAFCGCRRSLIQYYEQRALRKMRRRLTQIAREFRGW